MGPELLVLITYSVLAGKLNHLARQPKFMAVANKVSGGLLVGAAAGLAFVGQD